MPMARYRLIIKPLSPFQTPLHSDTLFGHICWALRYLKGEAELLKFLKAYNNDNAPLILSSGFPKDYLPMPVLRPLSVDEERALQNQVKTSLEFAREMKTLKKVSYIQLSAVEMLKNDLSYYNLYTNHLLGEILLENPKISKTEEVWHNAKNRLTDRVIEGKLFAKHDTFFSEETEFNVYIEALLSKIM
jgi:CRISPR-associated protein Csm4